MDSYWSFKSNRIFIEGNALKQTDLSDVRRNDDTSPIFNNYSKNKRRDKLGKNKSIIF